jgi:hypothetical protein
MSKNANEWHCIRFFYGTCKKGSKCKFQHITSKNTPCKFYLNGNCKFGDKCKLLHSEKQKYDMITKLISTSPENRTLDNSHIKASSLQEALRSCKKVIEAMTPGTIKDFTKESFEHPVTLTVDDLIENSLDTFGIVKRVKAMLRMYILNKYKLYPEEYFELWTDRVKYTERIKIGIGYYMTLDWKEGTMITNLTKLPHDDVFIAAFILGRHCTVSLMKSGPKVQLPVGK